MAMIGLEPLDRKQSIVNDAAITSTSQSPGMHATSPDSVNNVSEGVQSAAYLV